MYMCLCFLLNALFKYYLNTSLYICIFFFFSGDKKQGFKHLQLFFEFKSEFLNEFIMEGLCFSSSLYMTLVW